MSNENEVENLKLRAGASKAPVGIVPMHILYGMARILEDSACKYAPFNYMNQPLKDALESYDSGALRHRIACTLLGGQVTPESFAALDEDSGLPHIFHMLTGLAIIATLMIRDGVLKLDPGQGRRKRAKDERVGELALRAYHKVGIVEQKDAMAVAMKELDDAIEANLDELGRRIEKADGRPPIAGLIRDEGVKL